ncbi:MAG: LPS translocon maturation chaperone LptM [Rhodanobacteraceae bacterium]
MVGGTAKCLRDPQRSPRPRKLARQARGNLPMRLKSGLIFVSVLGVCALSGCGQKGPLTLPPTKPVPAAATSASPAPSLPPPPVSPATVAPPAAPSSTALPLPASAASSG